MTWHMHAGEKKHYHHHKKDTDDTYGSGSGDQSGGYGGDTAGDQVLPPSPSVAYACRCQVFAQQPWMQHR